MTGTDAFEEAPEASRDGSLLCRKAQGTTCSTCGKPIEGRRFEYSQDGSDEWHHGGCLTLDQMASWRARPLPPPEVL